MKMDHSVSGMDPRERTIEQLIELTLAAGPVTCLTDKYFSHTRRIVEKNGDVDVVYAVFLRHRVIAALQPIMCLVRRLVPEARIKTFFNEGDIVPSESKILEVAGPYARLSEVETLLLQKTGFPCVCAKNAYELCRAMPDAAFMDMHARHSVGAEMSLLAAYGASVGSAAARAADPDVRGFIGSSQELTTPLFGAQYAGGTMPHALVGYMGGDVVSALKQFAAAVPEVQTLVALVDYRGLETTDSLRVADWFYNESGLDMQGKKLGVRLDTHGGRFAEGLDYEISVDIVGQWLDVDGEYNIVEKVIGDRAFHLDSTNVLIDKVRRILFGKGVSVAAVIHARRKLDEAGFKQVLIIASSGFDAHKCLIASAANAPIDIVGTGSYLPVTLQETYATADIISYNGQARVKLGRERLFD